MGIPCDSVDQIHGTTYTAGGTFFPQGVNMGAHSIVNWCGKEPRYRLTKQKAGCIPWTYAPVVDLGRARWPASYVGKLWRRLLRQYRDGT